MKKRKISLFYILLILITLLLTCTLPMGKSGLNKNNKSNKKNNLINNNLNGPYRILPVAPYKIGWQKCYGGSANDLAYSITDTNDGGYIIAGETLSNDGDVTKNYTDIDIWIVKIDSIGNIQWEKTYGGSGIDKAHHIRKASDGGYIAAGYTTSNDGDISNNYGGKDIWIVKLDLGGNIVWEKCFGGTNDDEAYCVEQTNDGGYIISGNSKSNDHDLWFNFGGLDCFIVKIDSSGNKEWARPYGGTDDENAINIKQINDEGYIVSAWTRSENINVSSNSGYSDGWLVKLDNSGNIEWERSHGGTEDDLFYDTQQTDDGGYMSIGISESHSTDNGFYIWINKTNEWGITQRNQYITRGLVFSINKTSDNGFIISGMELVHINNQYDSNYILIKIDQSGDLEWKKSIGGSESEYAGEAMQTSDGNYIVAGNSLSNDGDVSGNHGGHDFWIAKLDYTTLNDNADLSNINFYPQGLFDFNPEITFYNVKINTPNITLKPEAYAEASSIRWRYNAGEWNTLNQDSGFGFNINAGDNINVEIEVTAENGINKKIYALDIYRLDDNANLDNITTYPDSFTGFSENITDYDFYTDFDTSILSITPIALNNNKLLNYRIDGSQWQALTNGDSISTEITSHTTPRIVEIEVTAEDGITKKTYTLNIYKKLNNDADLQNIILSEGEIDFDPNQTSYTFSINKTYVSIWAYLSDVNGKLRWRLNSGNWRIISNGEKFNVPLGDYGSYNKVRIKVIAADGITIKIYTLNFYRLDSPNPYSPYPYSTNLYNTKILSDYFTISEF